MTMAIEDARPLRVAIDGYNLAIPKGTGVATYAKQLGQALKDSGHTLEGIFGLGVGRDPEDRETLFYEALGIGSKKTKRNYLQRKIEDVRSFLPARPVPVRCDGATDRRAFAGRLPPFDLMYSSERLFERALRRFRLGGGITSINLENRPDVMHWTYPLPLRVEGAVNVYTFHDLVPLKLPFTTLDDKVFYRKLVLACAGVADHLVTVSEASRSDIIDMLGVPEDRITNTYQAVEPKNVDRGSHVEELNGIFGLQQDGYFLYFGAVEPKKNLGRLIEAYLGLATSTPLVIVGGRGWQSEAELVLLPDSVKTEGDVSVIAAGGQTVIKLDYLRRELLDVLIRYAKAVVFPSLYEGFGLPVLEALRFGTPVLTSTAGSLPEVAGDAAVLVDPYDVSSISGALRALDSDPALRDRLRAHAPVQVARFSQQRYRERLASLYGANGVLRRKVDHAAL